MILENFKKINFNYLNLLRYLMAAVFITAGFFRLFNYQAGLSEMQHLSLPSWFTWIISALEIGGGLMLVQKYAIARKAIFAFILFLTFALIWAIILTNGQLITKSAELFVFNLTSTDLFLHFVFLLILVSLLKNPHWK